MWLDIPGQHFRHYDYQVLVKLILEVNHIFSFFKEISIFKDKLLKRAVEKGYFEKHEADRFFSEIPNLKEIPAYVAGFVRSESFQDEEYKYRGKKGPKHYTVVSWEGKYKSHFLEKIKKEHNVKGRVEFQGIKRFSHGDAFVFNTGNLAWSQADWDSVIKSL